MNYSTFKFFFLVTFIVTIIGCSSNDDSSTESDLSINEFVYDGETYELVTAFITDENTTTDEASDIGINIFNVTNSQTNGTVDNVTRVFFDVEDITLQETTYNEIADYEVAINGSFNAGDYSEGTLLLSDNDPQSTVFASSTTVSIHNITETTIDLSFTFMRNDGKIISGKYNGDLINLNVED
ncbi:hypothetical protein GCM10009117_17760 [Gangjinia marincola]|uniref:DUF4382 domain-containing protein n=1 Tax=Gangjinia marincola TaxID=578463 RepID=A0ABN1MHH1_9FLAO